MKAALLLSGGMDSIALAYWKRPDLAVTIDYGQRPAEAEVEAARGVCNALGIEHEIVRVDCSALGSGDLAGTPPLAIAAVPEWWPYRNQLLITLAAARVLGRGFDSILLGTVASDGTHVDGRKAFIESLCILMEMQEGHIRVEAPAIGLSSVQLIQKSEIPISILAWAHSCHIADFACGYCRGCRKHFETTRDLGLAPY